MKNILLSVSILVIILSMVGCKKYLDIKPDKKLVVPSNIQDVQALLDNAQNMNERGADVSEASADNSYIVDSWYDGLTDNYKNMYLWQPEIFIGVTSNNNDWAFEYNTAYYANVALDALGGIGRNTLNSSSWDNCKGSALLYRAKSFYEIAQIWAKAYNNNTSRTDLGIPLRLSSDFNPQSVRSSVKDTYDQIISDLKAAALLLPNAPINPNIPMRPSKSAAYGLLARTYLTIGNFAQAKLYADSCLQINNQLLNYNQLNASASYPIPTINPEDIMLSWCAGYSAYLINPTISMIDSSLYKSYNTNDLRKTVFFYSNGNGTFSFKGFYYPANEYNGVATDEIYLTRAECNARIGNVVAAMSDLNTLMVNRWKSGTFTPFSAVSSSDALQQILTERRKELVMRMLRFTDIKRLNAGDGANITLKHIIHTQSYILPPNDPRYALPIPDDVIAASGIQQN